MTRQMLLMILAMLTLASPAAAQSFASDRITVTTQGKGRDVILVPGLTSSPAAWRHAVKARPGYRYHLVQVKGFAGTAPEANAKGALVASTAEEIARYIAESRLDKPAIVGHSMGGTVALMVGARHPQAVSKLMVVDQLPFMGAIFGPPGTTSDSVRPTADALRARSLAASPQARAAQAAAMTATMVATEAERPAVMQSVIDSDPAVTAETFHELVVTDLVPELPRIVVPATILYVTPKGVPLSDAQMDAVYTAAYAGLKGAKLVRVPDSAHFIMFDNPERFDAELQAFLG